MLSWTQSIQFHQPVVLRGIFSRGGKITFPDFFPSVKYAFSRLGRPQTNFSGFKRRQAKNIIKKKGGPLLIFIIFPSIFNLSPLPFQIPFFPLHLSIFSFFLVSLLPVGQQKISSEKCQGALCPLPVTPLPWAWWALTFPIMLTLNLQAITLTWKLLDKVKILDRYKLCLHGQLTFEWYSLSKAFIIPLPASCCLHDATLFARN